MPSRHHSVDSVGSSGVGRQSGQHLRHLGLAEPSFPADPTHGANGPQRRHLEAAGLCGLRTQQGRRSMASTLIRTEEHPWELAGVHSIVCQHGTFTR